MQSSIDGGPGPSETAPDTGRGRTGRPFWLGTAAVLAAALAVVGVVAFTPLLDHPVANRTESADDYQTGMQKAEALLAADGDEVNPVCRSRVLDKGERTQKAVVLLHGFTNCPAQFDAIADAYADAGYSVVEPRLPGHGESDRLTHSPSGVTAQSLADSGNLAVDIAAGLGEQVHVVGLSGGGTVAAWLAHERDEVSEAVLIAPLVVPKMLPEFAVAPVVRIVGAVPDVYLWWDGDQKEALAKPPYAYPRYSLRALGSFLALGQAVQKTDPGRSTRMDRLVVVTNANDAAVNAAGVAEIGDAVAASADTRIDHRFAAVDGFKHDLIDPQGENAEKLDRIYPTLGRLLGLPGLTAPTTGESADTTP